MSKAFFSSDHHLQHANTFLKFKNPDGSTLRPFTSLEEMHETMIERHNAVVKPNDRVYFCGDVSISRAGLKILPRFNGRKKLLRGNHDIFKLSDYTPHFEDILSCRIYQEHGLIVTHFPVHTGQLEHRFKTNVHGHLHGHYVMHNPTNADDFSPERDYRYVNICVEKINYTPISFDELLLKVQTLDL